ncbi:MAG: tetratricopeptide repeat protein, partial [Ignavibacteriae bacterium]|nr:tetratricopeptide repeat protein [Ignavibacteriota bacterium]
YIENIKITHSRDKNDIKFDNIESSIRKIINDINSDILNKRLVEPENNCAFSKYISIYKNPACKDIKEEIKNDLIGALMDESQKYISTYLNNPNNIDYKSTAIAEKMTYRILQIMDKNDFLYNNILCRYCHLKGINLYKNQPIEAEKYFNESIKLDKYSASNYNILGIILMNSDSFNKAKKFFLYSIYCSPNWSFPYINLGLIYKQEGNYDSALINYNKSIQLNPTCPEPYNNRGKLFLDTKNYQNALSDFNKSIELGLNTPIVYNNRANTFSELKEFDNAIADYSKALELDTSYAYIFFNRAQLYEEQTKYKKAIYDYLEYLKLAKNNLDFIYYHLGICYHRLDDEISAMRCYKKSLSINPDNADANFNIANMYYEKSYYEDAIEYYNKTLNSDSNYTEIYLWRGRSYFYLKNYDKAIIDLNKYVSINPDDFTGHHQRGILYFTIKEYKKAVEDFQYCIKINPQHAYTYTRLGEAYENLNNLKNAEYNYTKSVELSPDDFNALERLGGFYLKTQYYSGSLIMFNKLISLRTKASDYYCRGIAQYNLGKYEEALKDWEETLKIKPDFGKSIEKYIEKSKSLIK